MTYKEYDENTRPAQGFTWLNNENIMSKDDDETFSRNPLFNLNTGNVIDTKRDGHKTKNYKGLLRRHDAVI